MRLRDDTRGIAQAGDDDRDSLLEGDIDEALHVRGVAQNCRIFGIGLNFGKKDVDGEGPVGQIVASVDLLG